MTSQVSPESAALDVWVNLLRGHAAARRGLAAQLQSEHGLSVNEYETLIQLSRATDCTLRRVDLAEALQLTQSGVTRLLEGLEEAGYVERRACPQDARVAYAVLTDAGRTKLDEASGSHRAAIETLFGEHFSCDELTTLASLLARLPACQSER
jgi:DNA-binding MarR family transcriptional regulator